MMALDQRRRVARDGHRLDHVGIQGALGEELGFAGPFRGRFEHLDEGRPMILRLRSGSVTPLRRWRNNRGGLFVLQFDMKWRQTRRAPPRPGDRNRPLLTKMQVN
jgi:hypothetical protein